MPQLVEVMRPGPLGRLGEEMVVGPLGVRHDEIAQPLQRPDVASARLDGRDRELEVEDWLRGEAGHCCGADALQAHGDTTERVPETT